LGAQDLLIAAHAICCSAILVTNDLAFGKVPDLKTEDWSAG
jgi:tRNA(fMet)-specific endonuclease VapC